MTRPPWAAVKLELIELLELSAAQLLPATSAWEGAAAEAGAESRQPVRIGPWRIEQEIGRGGMGTVYRARREDGAFEQMVAIKLVRPELSSEMLRRRFLAERETTSDETFAEWAHRADEEALQ